ncbi:M28 family peptidase [Shewanella nanhaiensis]|uniref:M28 family peptidase n=1 Tax=Shewanella nanhaiensis TaxID=2864872 RepID=A0ABS7E0R2_9GAMM|nr:M28 family peptidase [Shewanella nanhaiensis]MBW8183243.1 M28 family peptidase [Shewanella nanhaiensis]
MSPIQIKLTSLRFSHTLSILLLFSLTLSGCSTFSTSCKTQLKANWVDQQALKTDLTQLTSAEFEGRKTGTQGAALTRTYLNERFTQIGLTPWLSAQVGTKATRLQSKSTGKFNLPFTYSQGFSEREGSNVVGVLKASTPSTSWRVVIAHYDHLGVKGRKLYPGADDNASGIAAMLQLAHYAATHPELFTKTNLMFVATDAEEPGLYGGYALAELLSQQNITPNNKQIELAINLDMVGRPERSMAVYLEGRRGFKQFPLIKQKLINETGLCIKAKHPRKRGKLTGNIDWLRASDHYPLHKIGVPWLYFGVPPHQDYHAPSDTQEKIDFEFLAAVTSSAHQLLIIDSLQLGNIQ